MATDAHVLMRAYCGLVLMELALKDHLALTGMKHDVPAMLHRLATTATKLRPTLNQFRTELATNLANLHTQNNNGTHGPVNFQVFPGKSTDCRWLSLMGQVLTGKMEVPYEMASDWLTYQSHLESAHFMNYKMQTAEMVQSLQLTKVDPVAFGIN